MATVVLMGKRKSRVVLQVWKEKKSEREEVSKTSSLDENKVTKRDEK